MTTQFATTLELTARLSSAYTVPADSDKLLGKASELIDEITLGRAQEYWDTADVDLRAELSKATCDQVEFWLEVGEEHDVLGLSGQLAGGRVQVQRVPGQLGQRARRTLLKAGILWAGADAF